MPRLRRRSYTRVDLTDEQLDAFIGDGMAGVLAMADPANIFADADDMRRAWETNRDALLLAWIQRSPRTRPWPWWEYDAPEPLRHDEAEADYLLRLDLLLPGEADE